MQAKDNSPWKNIEIQKLEKGLQYFKSIFLFISEKKIINHYSISKVIKVLSCVFL